MSEVLHAMALYTWLRELVDMPIRSKKWRSGGFQSLAR